MSESVNRPPLENFSKNYTKRTTTDAEAESQLAESIKTELLSKLPQIVEHFSAYEPASVQHMVESYAFMRMRFTKEASYYEKKAEELQFDYKEDAEKCLAMIQHKKLFDLQCRWRAGEIELPGIEFTMDFYRWERDLFNCPFVPPIAPSEVDMLINYLESHPDEVILEPHFYNWQRYEYLKLSAIDEIIEERAAELAEQGVEEEDMEIDVDIEEFYQDYAIVSPLFDTGIPPWYKYYDGIMGTGGLLAKEDVKLPLEHHYEELYHEHKKKDNEVNIEKGSVPTGPLPQKHVPKQHKPWLGLDLKTEDAIAQMVEKFESRDVQKLFKNYELVELKSQGEEKHIDEEIESLMVDLHGLNEHFPIEANADWRQGLLAAYNKFKARKIIAVIPSAFDDYRMRTDTGVGFPVPDDVEMPDYLKTKRQNLIEGRKLAAKENS